MSLGVGFDKFFDFLFSFIAFFGGQVDSRLERGFWENILSFSAADLVEDLDAFRPIYTSRLVCTFARLPYCLGYHFLSALSSLRGIITSICFVCGVLSSYFICLYLSPITYQLVTGWDGCSVAIRYRE
jgi:hypothetical protein